MKNDSVRNSLSLPRDMIPAVERSGVSQHGALSTALGAPQAVPVRGARRILRWIIVLAFLAAAGLSIFAWSAHRSQNVLARNALVRGDITEVGTRFAGTLVTTEARAGDKVEAGQVIARLEDSHLRAQELEAVAQIQGLEKELLLEQASIEQERASRRVRLQEAEAKAAAARAEVTAARLRAHEAQEFQRARATLAEQGMISGEALRESNTRAQLAAENISVASAQAHAAQSAAQSAAVDLRGVAVQEMRLQVLRSQIDAAKGRLARVRADIESTAIRAPAEATVVNWLIKPGGSVDVGKPVVALSMGHERWIEAWIDEDDLGRVRVGSPAMVTLASQQGREVRGVVQRIGVATDYEQPAAAVPEPRAARMRAAPVVAVDIRLEEHEETLIPGLSAAVAIRTEQSFHPFTRYSPQPVATR